jgi:hypothetical protein
MLAPLHCARIRRASFCFTLHTPLIAHRSSAFASSHSGEKETVGYDNYSVYKCYFLIDELKKK